MLAAFGIARASRLACGSGYRIASTARLFQTDSLALSSGSEAGSTDAGSSRVPSTVVRGTYAGVNVAYAVTHGDAQRGYPAMTVAEMCDALDARYKQKVVPAERHMMQVIDKVKSAEDATMAARAVATFHASKTFLAASDDRWGLGGIVEGSLISTEKPGKRGGLHPNSLLMFVEKSFSAGNAAAAVSAAAKHHVMGFKVTREACDLLLAKCETATQAITVYELWRSIGGANAIDEGFATQVVSAAARVGDTDAAKRWMKTFQASGVEVDTRGMDLIEEETETIDEGTADETHTVEQKTEEEEVKK